MKKKHSVTVIIPKGYKPSEDELWAAYIIAETQGAEVKFIVPSNDYEQQTPDILVDGLAHEIKTPKSGKSNNVYTLLIGGAKQADILIVNASKTPLSIDRIKSVARRVLNNKQSLEVIIIIDRQGAISKVTR